MENQAKSVTLTKAEIMAKIAALEKQLVKVQLELRDLWLQIHEGLDCQDLDVV